jgi:hypothetical protein
VDTQLHILAPLFLFSIGKYPRQVVKAIICIFMASMFYSFIATLVKNLEFVTMLGYHTSTKLSPISFVLPGSVPTPWSTSTSRLWHVCPRGLSESFSATSSTTQVATTRKSPTASTTSCGQSLFRRWWFSSSPLPFF